MGLNIDTNSGKIVAIRGHIAEVSFPAGNKPAMHEILVGEEDSTIRLKVYASSNDHSYYCFVLCEPEKLSRQCKIVRTGELLSLPVGKEVLGRVMDVYGNAVDGGGEIVTKERWEVLGRSTEILDVHAKEEVWETGIKVIDMFAPLLKGGKMGLFGGAGVG